jgi:hypothetical protein
MRCSSATGWRHLAAAAALTELAIEEAKEEVEQNLSGSFLEELRSAMTSADPRSFAAPPGSAAISRAER